MPAGNSHTAAPLRRVVLTAFVLFALALPTLAGVGCGGGDGGGGSATGTPAAQPDPPAATSDPPPANAAGDSLPPDSPTGGANGAPEPDTLQDCSYSDDC
jgi:hypothetical protein